MSGAILRPPVCEAVVLPSGAQAIDFCRYYQGHFPCVRFHVELLEVVSTVGGGCWSVERMDNVFVL